MATKVSKNTEAKIEAFLISKAKKVARKLHKAGTGDQDDDYTPFTWTKKIQRDVQLGRVNLEDYTLKAAKKRRRESEAEAEEVKRRREKAAAERASRAEEIAFLERERIRVEAKEGEKKEREFEFDQCRVKAKIRILEGRAKTCDLLALYVKDEEVVLDSPVYSLVDGLKGEEVEEVLRDVGLYVEFDGEGNGEYWKAVKVCCEWRLAEVRGKNGVFDDRGVHSSVRENVESFLEGKSYEDLIELEAEVGSRLRSGEAKLVEFWETIARQIPLYKARAYLKKLHNNRMIEGGTKQEKIKDVEDEGEKVIMEEEKEDGHIVDEEVCLGDNQEPGCIKPKYVMHVNSGYFWNPYNRTHYDHDNPPPKMVTGYKFDVFYPDLMDKSQTPMYFLEEDKENSGGGTCIIRFHGGAPYEDIGFRIVDGEWQLSRKKGFKCAFDGKVLHLHFSFKRGRYRR